jgi:hypothetical protein
MALREGIFIATTQSIHSVGLQTDHIMPVYVLTLSSEPAANEKIIGFYGRSDWGIGVSGIQQFGIITAPRDIELPMSIYDLPELQNTDGGTDIRDVSGQL